MNWLAIAWLALMVAFLILEACTVSTVSIWFAAGALAAFVASLFQAPLWLQGTLFAVVSVAMLLALRPVVKNKINPRITKTNVDAVIGAEGIVTEKVDNMAAAGRVKLEHMEWSARSTDGRILEPGTRVKVDRVEGVKVFVTPAEVCVQ
jgi:membrane protein implicated in regulation of membrane protease activity